MPQTDGKDSNEREEMGNSFRSTHLSTPIFQPRSLPYIAADTCYSAGVKFVTFPTEHGPESHKERFINQLRTTIHPSRLYIYFCKFITTMVSDIKGGTKTEGGSEQGTEEDIWTEEG
jgi:hypothetical protein